MDVAEDHAVGERADERDHGDVDERADERPGRLVGAPITSGVTMPARLALKLKMPAVSPISSFGATSEITVQPRFVMPWPKNASDMIAMTSVSAGRHVVGER